MLVLDTNAAQQKQKIQILALFASMFGGAVSGKAQQRRQGESSVSEPSLSFQQQGVVSLLAGQVRGTAPPGGPRW